MPKTCLSQQLILGVVHLSQGGYLLCGSGAGCGADAALLGSARVAGFSGRTSRVGFNIMSVFRGGQRWRTSVGGLGRGTEAEASPGRTVQVEASRPREARPSSRPRALRALRASANAKARWRARADVRARAAAQFCIVHNAKADMLFPKLNLNFLGLFKEAEGRRVRVLARAYMHIRYTYVYIYGPQVQRPVQCTKPAEGATLRMARRPRLPTVDAWITRLTPSFAGSRKQTDIFGRCTCMYKVSTRLYLLRPP